MEDKRIYAVVAGTVQTTAPGRLKSVVQPLGRQVAQVAHVVSKLRFIEAVDCQTGLCQASFTSDLHAKTFQAAFTPITTIVLQARDSAELRHVEFLLLKHKIKVVEFSDTNPEYGSGEVMTAICTEPIEKKKIQGILDYLPLWGCQ